MKKKISVISLITLILMLMQCVYAIEGVIGGSVGVKPVDNGFAIKIIGAFKWIGYAIALIMLVYVGIKYTIASADERADMKNSLVKYLIGAVLISGAVTFAGWIFNVLQ